jgi:hypothetical protein
MSILVFLLEIQKKSQSFETTKLKKKTLLVQASSQDIKGFY